MDSLVQERHTFQWNYICFNLPKGMMPDSKTRNDGKFKGIFLLLKQFIT